MSHRYRPEQHPGNKPERPGGKLPIAAASAAAIMSVFLVVLALALHIEWLFIGAAVSVMVFFILLFVTRQR